MISTTPEDHQRLSVKISGRVQGVWYRASTADQAKARGITGWVRNLPDGRVEAVFEGRPEALEGMLAWCRQGPAGARVDDIQEELSPASGEFRLFSVRY